MLAFRDVVSVTAVHLVPITPATCQSAHPKQMGVLHPSQCSLVANGHQRVLGVRSPQKLVSQTLTALALPEVWILEVAPMEMTFWRDWRLRYGSGWRLPPAWRRVVGVLLGAAPTRVVVYPRAKRR